MTAAAIATLVISVGAGSASAVQPTAAGALQAGQDAYEYGFPLLEILRVRHEQTSVACPNQRGDAPINSFSNAGKFATAADRTVVAVNTDTLYSIAHLDLGKGPVVLSHPRMGKRYFSFALLDPYSNVIATPGLRENGGGPGRYAIRWTKGPAAERSPRGAEVIRSKYRRVWVIGRTLAKGKHDQRKAKRLMRRYRLTLANGRQRTFPRDCKPGRPEELPTPTDGETFIRMLNGALEHNPPPPRDRPLLAELAPYGVGPGLSPERAGLTPDVLQALYTGVAGRAATLASETKLHALQQSQGSNGWYLPEENIGRYGTDYRFRAMIASAGLGANTREEAIYPVGITDADGALFNGASDYRLTFASGDEPPARYFWSLTMYDFDGYLVANDEDRYSLGPSHPPLARRSDGSIVIAIQQSRPTEPDVNWLPSPPAQFRLNLRLYGPRGSALSGAWLPPAVVRATGD